MSHRWIATLPILALACAPTEPDGQPLGEVVRTERDRFGLLTCSEATADRTCVTNRAIAGVSMGSHGAGMLGFHRPDLFDSVAMLGVPMVDWVYMLRNIQRGYLGGFCDRETILAHMDRVNDPAGPGFCGPARGTEEFVPGKIMEPDQDFNHWYRWIDNGRGGSFGRNKLRESFQDITLAFGNALYYNPESPYYPPGVPMDFRSRPDDQRCATPHKIAGLKHKEYNPDGTYDTIAFCDTRTNSGEFDPSNPSQQAFEMLLAVDYNGNGVRDAAEPIITFVSERYQDVGMDPNDVFDYATNPAGRGKNWKWDEGEPYEDNGLDGVPSSGDFGEGNGKFDWNPNIQNYFELNPRQMIEQMPEGHLKRMNIYADAGIRDFLFSVGGTNWLWGALQNRVGKGTAKDYVDFPSLPGAKPEYDVLGIDLEPANIGKHVYVRYGNPEASETEIQAGDGHHVGTPFQVINRFLTAMHFIQSRFRNTDRRESKAEFTSDLIQPKTFYSAALADTRKYGIVLPPGYDDPANAGQTYPVLYFLHGQGQESDHLLASGILFFGYMAGSTVDATMRNRQSDWGKFIIVFPDSTCRAGDCASGNFNSNHKGIDGNGPKFMDSLYELMAHVDQTYRTAPPVEIPIEEAP